jgi:hypothetical protein
MCLTKAEPANLLNATVTVRGANAHAIYDGVWVNGERSWDTYVLIDGLFAYHSPIEVSGTNAFEVHEAAGGGRAR